MAAQLTLSNIIVIRIIVGSVFLIFLSSLQVYVICS